MTRSRARKQRVKRNRKWREEHRHIEWVELKPGPNGMIGTFARRTSKAEFFGGTTALSAMVFIP